MEQLKGKQTPGKILIDARTFVYALNNGSPRQNRFMVGFTKGRNDDGSWISNTEQEANAALCAEAHNVANETQMWPREMQERIKMLEERAGAYRFKVGDKVVNTQAHGWGEGVVEFIADHQNVSVLWDGYRHALHSPDQLSITTPSTIN